MDKIKLTEGELINGKDGITMNSTMSLIEQNTFKVIRFLGFNFVVAFNTLDIGLLDHKYTNNGDGQYSYNIVGETYKGYKTKVASVTCEYELDLTNCFRRVE